MFFLEPVILDEVKEGDYVFDSLYIFSVSSSKYFRRKKILTCSRSFNEENFKYKIGERYLFSEDSPIYFIGDEIALDLFCKQYIKNFVENFSVYERSLESFTINNIFFSQN